MVYVLMLVMAAHIGGYFYSVPIKDYGDNREQCQMDEKRINVMIHENFPPSPKLEVWCQGFQK